MKFASFNKAALAAVLATGLAACGSDDDSNSDNNVSKGTKEISLSFAAQLNGAELQCDQNTETVGTAQTPADIKYFGMYISELEVATADGEFVPVALDASTTADVERGVSLVTYCGTNLSNNQISGTVEAAAEYSRVRFTMGVPEQHNHLDATQTEGILAKEIAMHWNWTVGYKHARMDAAGWNIHLGSTNCSGENADAQCSNGNRPTYTFDNVDFDSDKVVFDYAALVNSSDISTDAGGAPGCMSGGTDPECGQVFTALGLDLSTGQCLNNDCDSQTWVRVEAK